MHVLRALFNALVFILVLILIWFAVPSGLLLRPLTITYNVAENDFIFKRQVRWFTPIVVRYVHTLYRSNGQVCVFEGTRIFAPGIAEDRFDVPYSAVPCIKDTDTTYYMTWSILVGGIIPLRPVVSIHEPIRVIRPLPRREPA